LVTTLVAQVQITQVHIILVAQVQTIAHTAQLAEPVIILVPQTVVAQVPTTAQVAVVVLVLTTALQTLVVLKQQTTAPHGIGFLTLLSLFPERSAMLPIAFLQHHTQTQMELVE